MPRRKNTNLSSAGVEEAPASASTAGGAKTTTSSRSTRSTTRTAAAQSKNDALTSTDTVMRVLPNENPKAGEKTVSRKRKQTSIESRQGEILPLTENEEMSKPVTAKPKRLKKGTLLEEVSTLSTLDENDESKQKPQSKVVRSKKSVPEAGVSKPKPKLMQESDNASESKANKVKVKSNKKDVPEEKVSLSSAGPLKELPNVCSELVTRKNLRTSKKVNESDFSSDTILKETEKKIANKKNIKSKKNSGDNKSLQDDNSDAQNCKPDVSKRTKADAIQQVSADKKKSLKSSKTGVQNLHKDSDVHVELNTLRPTRNSPRIKKEMSFKEESSDDDDANKDDDDEWEDVDSDFSDFKTTKTQRKAFSSVKVPANKSLKQKLTAKSNSKKHQKKKINIEKSKAKKANNAADDDDEKSYVCEDENEESSESEASDWEEVPDLLLHSPSRQRVIQPVEVTVFNKRGSKKSKIEQAMDEIRRRINRKLIISQNDAHKVHLLCSISLGLRMNSIGNNQLFKSCLLSIFPTKLLKKSWPASCKLENLEEIRDWFLKTVAVEVLPSSENIARYKVMADVILLRKKTSVSELEYALMFIALCRSLGLDARIVHSLQPLTYKASDVLKPRPLSRAFLEKLAAGGRDDPCAKIDGRDRLLSEEKKENVETVVEKKKESEKKEDKGQKSKGTKKRKNSEKSDEGYAEDEEVEEEDDEDGGDEEFDDKKSKKRKTLSKKANPNKRVKNSEEPVSSRSNATKNKKQKDVCNWWVEVHVESSWITVSGAELVVNTPEEVDKRLTKPISYVLGFCTENFVKDLTRKYDSNWLKSTSKSRLDETWWNETLVFFADNSSDKSLEEDILIHDALLKKGFPTSISEYKNHPLYALQRHLLRYEAIYPPTAVVLGYVKEEPIFARECVHTLCSKEKWLIEGRRILPDQEPYKFVKSLPKPGKQKNEPREMLGLFGTWQTELFIGPEAVDGQVPKNKYGNVDLFKPWMLPQGTVHLKGTYYGMAKAARKAGIDAAPAMVGWEFHKGLNHPILQGWVVCKENVDALLKAWKEEQELEKEKQEEKREQRILDNWKKLVKHLMIRNRLRKKLNIMSISEAARKASSQPKKRVRAEDGEPDPDESASSFKTVSEASSLSSKESNVPIKKKMKL